jgi:SAM-dependent methyltransferase
VLASSLEAYVAGLPEAFRHDAYRLLRRGVHDDRDVAVYVNASDDFAFLFPPRAVDYSRYQPRVKKLGLEAYRQQNLHIERRYQKVARYFQGERSVLEVGSFDGEFLRHAKSRNVALSVASVEPDRNTDSVRMPPGEAGAPPAVPLVEYRDLAHALASGRKFDVVCMFHVLEHVLDPEPFLAQVQALVAAEGVAIFEVPSLDDPLRRLYRLEEYEEFYFTTQHPYYYTLSSLCRLIRSRRFEVEEQISHQRYGLENHIGWIRDRRPGGSAEVRAALGGLTQYTALLEERGVCDAAIVVARGHPRAS